MEEEKNKGGRPVEYDPKYAKMAYDLCLLGYTGKELADFLGVNESTIYEWKSTYPRFSKSIDKARDQADVKVTKSLYKRATGYKLKTKYKNKKGEEIERIDEIQPDITAIKYWLNNRQRGRWSEKQEIEHSGEVGIPLLNGVSKKENVSDNDSN